VGEPRVAVCLLPGTELAFDEDVEQEARLTFMPSHKLGSTVARFRHVDEDQPHRHHDALEFSNGATVLLTHLRKGQAATVLQLPVEAVPSDHQAAPDIERPVAAPRPTLAATFFGR